MKIVIKDDRVKNGKVIISENIQWNIGFLSSYIKEGSYSEANVIDDDLIKYTNNDDFKGNLYLYLAFMGYSKIDAIKANENFNKDLSIAAYKSWKSNKSELCYIFKEMFNIDPDIKSNWSINDIDYVYFLNEKLSSLIFEQVRWFERKLYYSLLFLIQANEIDLKKWLISNENNASNKNKKDVSISILKNISEEANTNEKIIKEISFTNKIELFKILDISIVEKNRSFKMIIDKEISISEEESFKNTIELYKVVHDVRNSVSHNSFILSKGFQDLLKQMIAKTMKFGRNISLNSGTRNNEFVENIIKTLDSMNEKFYDKNKIDNIGKSFAIIKKYIKTNKNLILKKVNN